MGRAGQRARPGGDDYGDHDVHARSTTPSTSPPPKRPVPAARSRSRKRSATRRTTKRSRARSPTAAASPSRRSGRSAAISAATTTSIWTARRRPSAARAFDCAIHCACSRRSTSKLKCESPRTAVRSPTSARPGGARTPARADRRDGRRAPHPSNQPLRLREHRAARVADRTPRNWPETGSAGRVLPLDSRRPVLVFPLEGGS